MRFFDSMKQESVLSSITLEQTDQVLIATLSRGKANAMNHEMFCEIAELLDRVESEPQIGALLFASSQRRFFSPGLDIAEVFEYDRDQMTSFFTLFLTTISRLTHVSKPTVVAIGGHAYAGGAILATACDFRVMARGSYGFALNEINLGFAIPGSIHRMVEHAIGGVTARRLFLTGDAVTPDQALQFGIATELVDADDLQPTAMKLATLLADKEPVAYQQIKSDLGNASPKPDRSALENEVIQFVDQWFSPAAEAKKLKLIALMRGRLKKPTERDRGS